MLTPSKSFPPPLTHTYTYIVHTDIKAQATRDGDRDIERERKGERSLLSRLLLYKLQSRSHYYCTPTSLGCTDRRLGMTGSIPSLYYTHGYVRTVHLHSLPLTHSLTDDWFDNSCKTYFHKHKVTYDFNPPLESNLPFWRMRLNLL